MPAHSKDYTAVNTMSRHFFMHENTKEQITQLEQQREKMVTNIFWTGLQIALIFGLPVALGVFVGKKIGVESYVGIMIGTFIFSWVLVIFRYRSISKKIEDIESRIRALRKILQVDSKNDSIMESESIEDEGRDPEVTR